MLYLTSTVAASGFAAWKIHQHERAFLLPGQTTAGHHQIETDCDACHTPFGGVKQDACEGCHGAELELADDSHPASKFKDPRNADRLAAIDALECVTCHVEHRTEGTFALGVTQPGDYCVLCHRDIGEERATHVGLAFDTCQNGGCHNFHDNRGLNQDYLERHFDEPPTKDEAVLATFARSGTATAMLPDAPPGVSEAEHATEQWRTSAHASGHANCSDCHGGADDASAWQPHPGTAACKRCHAAQVRGFLGGKHGMREAQGLPAMTPALARLPMRADAHERALSCNSCHPAHAYDRERAAVEACLGCHDDAHTLAYEGSPHHQLWKAELAGKAKPGTGVSCASCHLPRLTDDAGELVVQHNQNDNLRPNEKMLRNVCSKCHGVAFALDALADRAVVEGNFRTSPTTHVPSVDWVRAKVATN